MTLREKQSVFAFNISRLILFIYNSGFEVTFGEAWRTEFQQAEYIRTGRSKTMNSRHLSRLAVDFNFFYRGQMMFSETSNKIHDLKMMQYIGEFWMSLHKDNVWGGDWDSDHSVLDESFTDPYHFEMKPG